MITKPAAHESTISLQIFATYNSILHMHTITLFSHTVIRFYTGKCDTKISVRYILHKEQNGLIIKIPPNHSMLDKMMAHIRDPSVTKLAIKRQSLYEGFQIYRPVSYTDLEKESKN